MKEAYKKALAEVNSILENTEQDIRDKVPNRFKNFIKNNMDETHKITLEQNKRLIEQDLMEETREILALIYRDYICDSEQRKKLIIQEQEKRIKKEQEEQEKYNINFEKRKEKNIIEILENENETALIQVQEEKWYKKIINKILDIFRIKKH